MPLHKAQDFYELAVRYCSRRETSAEKMRQYLNRKYREWHGAPSEDLKAAVQSAIQEAIDKLTAQNIINDNRYAEMLGREYQRRNKGRRYIELKLKEKGLHDAAQDWKDQESAQPENQFQLAKTQVEKLLQRPKFKNLESQYELKTKVLHRLVAAGFDFGVAKRAIEAILLTRSE